MSKVETKKELKERIAILEKALDSLSSVPRSKQPPNIEITSSGKFQHLDLNKFRSIIDQSPNMIIITNPDGRIEYINEELKRSLGFTEEDLLGKVKVFFPDNNNGNKYFENMMRRLMAGETFEGEVEILNKKGDSIWVKATVSPVVNHGKVENYISVFHDITNDILLKTEYLRQNDIYKNLVDNLTVMLSLTDTEGRFIFVNRRSEEFMNMPSESMVNKTVLELFPTDGKEILKGLKKIHREKKGYSTEVRYNINGQIRDLEMIRLPIMNEKKEVEFVLSIGTDVSHRKKMEKLMKFQHSIDSLQSLAETFEKSLEMLFDNLFALDWVDAGGLYLFNPNRDTLRLVYHRGLSDTFIEATESFGADTANAKMVLQGKSRFVDRVSYLLDTEDTIKKEGITFICVLPLLHRDKVIGSLNLASKTVTELDDYEKLAIESITGRLANVVVLIQTQEDLRKKNEELSETLENLQINWQMLVQKGRLESLGELLAGLAHEINQPLSIISLALGNMEASLNQDEPDRDYIQSKFISVMRNIDKIKELIDHVRIFSRDQHEMKFEQIEVNLTIENALSLVREQLQHHGIRVSLDRDEGIGYAIGNPSRLEQVILNLVSNARDAMDEKDKAGESPGYTKRLEIRSKRSGKNVTITVRDNGTGMPPEIMDRMFNPFFTTKSHGQGTGLGLPIVYGIIREMRGEITCNSVPGEYTELIISLPAPIRKQKL